MKNRFISLLTLLTITFGYSQVGINTQSPQGVFHVDAGKNNNETGAPTIDQQADDFTILKSGDVGIGTTAPTARLHIVSKSGSVVRIEDGTQGENKILVSDSDGNASWRSSSATRPVVFGVLPGSTPNVTSSTDVYLNTNITLPPGSWMVSMGTTVWKAVANTAASWFIFTLADSATAYAATADVDTAHSGAQIGVLGAPNSNTFSFGSGSLAITNSGTSNKTYYLWARRVEGDATMRSPMSSSVLERYFYAIPTNF